MAPLFPDRTHPDVLCLFDVDGTLTPARQGVSPEMTATLAEVRKHAAIGFVGGSDLVKITEQLQVAGQPSSECGTGYPERRRSMLTSPASP